MWVVVVLAMAAGFQTTDSNQGGAGVAFTRIRPSEPYLTALLREGYERSATLHELVDALQRTNVILSLQPLACAGGRIRSCLVGVKGSQRERHIWIKVDPQHTIKDRLIAAVAHELQHAAEIAEDPDVVDAASALALYRRIAVGACGRGLSEECETARALATERRVTEELAHQPDEHARDITPVREGDDVRSRRDGDVDVRQDPSGLILLVVDSFGAARRLTRPC